MGQASRRGLGLREGTRKQVRGDKCTNVPRMTSSRGKWRNEKTRRDSRDLVIVRFSPHFHLRKVEHPSPRKYHYFGI